MGRGHSRAAIVAACGIAVIQMTGACASLAELKSRAAGNTSLRTAEPASPAVPVDASGTRTDLVETRWGPLGDADRELLVKVRQAGLWEMPVGEQAAVRASRAVTRKNLGEIARQHARLDADVRKVAARLQVPLPDQPTEEQQGWIAEISAKQGLEYDKTAVARLRMAHGKVFPFIHQVRASTQNTLIRDFAERAAEFVNTHMDLLEDTGLVNSSGLPSTPKTENAPDVIPAGQPVPAVPPAMEAEGKPSPPMPSSGVNFIDTPTGPLSAADRDFLVKVRQAGLWEMPVGMQAATRAARARTRQNLQEIAEQHGELDALVIDVATRLRVPLPNEPSAQQREWIEEISAQTGGEWDRVAVQRLRMAHGKVFGLIAQVRASTRNTLMRDFAERTAEFVNTHMDLLEDTGLADASALPPPPKVADPPALPDTDLPDAAASQAPASGAEASDAPVAAGDPLDPPPAGEPSVSAGPTGGAGLVETRWGPLSAADRDLLVKVRQAGLWEIPVGEQAAVRASRAVTRKNLGEIARQHARLDADVRKVAARLQVPLPDQPTEEQQGWIAEISAKQGLEYDKTAVARLRMAHGKVFPFIHQVRASTQNTLIRDFAERAAEFVNTHMDLLEETGLADATTLPTPPPVTSAPDPVPSGQPAPTAPPATSLPSA